MLAPNAAQKAHFLRDFARLLHVYPAKNIRELIDTVFHGG
jgi:hypothetical protein